MQTPISIDAFRKFRFMGDLKSSPSGDALFARIGRVREDGRAYETALARFSGGKMQPLTQWDVKQYAFADERTVYFLSDRPAKSAADQPEKTSAPKTAIWMLSLEGGEAQLLVDLPYSIKAIYPAGGDVLLLLENYDPAWSSYAELDEQERSALCAKRKEEEDYLVFDEIPFWHNGVGVTNKRRTRLARYDLKTGAYRRITDAYVDVDALHLDGKRSRAVFTACGYTDKAPRTNSVMLYSIETDTLEDITPLLGCRYDFAAFFGEDIIALQNDMRILGINQNPAVLLFSPADKRVLHRTEPDLSFWSSVGSDVRLIGGPSYATDGERFYLLSTKEHCAQVFSFDRDLSMQQLTHAEGSIDAIACSGETLYAVALLEQHLQELYEIKDGTLIPCTHENTALDDTYVARPTPIAFDQGEGKGLGWILLPKDFSARESIPVILDIHGGPKTVYGTVYYHEMQYWAGLGYAVIFANPRGSDGYGDHFSDIRGRYGEVDYEDLMHFVDAALSEYPTLDPRRLYVTGGSYGGFMTNWIIGHTNRFRAAASQRSIANWISMWGTTDIGYDFAADQTAGDVWEDMEAMWRQSPMRYAQRVTTPTLFIHSDEDYRCYMVEAMQMFTALKYHGCESRMVVFKGENHELSRSGKPHHRVRRLREITTWFAEHGGMPMPDKRP